MVSNKYSAEKKALLAVGTALLAPTVQVFMTEQYVYGAVLVAMAVGCFIGYDYLDDHAKGQYADEVASVAKQLDEDQMNEIAEYIADNTNELYAQYNGKSK